MIIFITTFIIASIIFCLFFFNPSIKKTRYFLWDDGYENQFRFLRRWNNGECETSIIGNHNKSEWSKNRFTLFNLEQSGHEIGACEAQRRFPHAFCKLNNN